MSVWATARAACAALATLLAVACAPLPTTPDAGAGGAAQPETAAVRPKLRPLERQPPAAAE
ncbi:MAG: hypothetical protein J7603_26390, partial [Pseudacidovorax sp.]|nr:hypothetical protein [Pseudacidovorax sp.]